MSRGPGLYLVVAETRWCVWALISVLPPQPSAAGWSGAPYAAPVQDTDPLAAVAAEQGVPSALAAARDGIDARLRDRGRRRTGPEVTAESLLLGAAASAALAGSTSRLADLRAGRTDAIAAGCLRLSIEVIGLLPIWRVSPLQALARMHALASDGAAPADRRGRPAGPAGAERLRDLAATLGRPTRAPALAVAAIVHAELATAEPFRQCRRRRGPGGGAAGPRRPGRRPRLRDRARGRPRAPIRWPTGMRWRRTRAAVAPASRDGCSTPPRRSREVHRQHRCRPARRVADGYERTCERRLRRRRRPLARCGWATRRALAHRRPGCFPMATALYEGWIAAWVPACTVWHGVVLEPVVRLSMR